MAYKELRSDYSLTQSNTGMEGTKAFINAVADACTQEDLPALNDPFSVAYPALKLRNIKAVPYNVNDSGTTEYKYLCTYGSTPDPDYWEENYYSARYTGGTSIISLDLDKDGSEWKWIPTIGDTEATSAILKRQVYFQEIRGTYSVTLTVPQETNEEYYPGYVSYGYFLTGGDSDTYGIFNSLGKINSQDVKISPIETTYEFQSGQLLFTSFDASTTVDRYGLQVWLVTINYSYRVVNLIVGDTTNYNVPYPWIYLINDKASSGEFPYQIPVKATPSGSFPQDGVYLYDFSDFGTSLDPTP